MSQSTFQDFTRWSNTKKWILGLTVSVVVVPALIHGGIDLYKAALDIPKTDTERINTELFRKYLNVPPVTSLPVPIRSSTDTVEMKFFIFEDGDIYVEYGNLSHWFPAPQPDAMKVPGFSFVSKAIAHENAYAHGIGAYQQTDRFDGLIISRKRVYENGVIEQQQINSRSGEILKQTSTPSQTTAADALHQLAPFGVVDLQTHKNPLPGDGSQATICKTKLGKCALVAPIPKSADCSCYTAYGTVPGLAQ